MVPALRCGKLKTSAPVRLKSTRSLAAGILLRNEIVLMGVVPAPVAAQFAALTSSTVKKFMLKPPVPPVTSKATTICPTLIVAGTLKVWRILRVSARPRLPKLVMACGLVVTSSGEAGTGGSPTAETAALAVEPPTTSKIATADNAAAVETAMWCSKDVAVPGLTLIIPKLLMLRTNSIGCVSSKVSD